jgi:phage tail-like protein
MPPFAVNPQRLDPYKDYKFRIRWDGRYVAGVSAVGALKRVTDVIEHREGGFPSTPNKSPGVSRFEPITLERGRTHDSAFEEWANLVWRNTGLGHEVALANFRKDVSIDLLNEAGQLVMRWNVFRCWPSEYVALSDLHADGDGPAFERLTLQHEGWERDREVAEPKEPPTD